MNRNELNREFEQRLRRDSSVGHSRIAPFCIISGAVIVLVLLISIPL